MTLSNPDVIFQVACCLHKAASELLGEYGLIVPERGGITHKGPDYHCEDCTSLWVWAEGSQTPLLFGEDPLHQPPHPQVCG